MINEKLKLTGRVTISVNDELVRVIPNLVVTAGKGYAASRMKDSSVLAMSHMAMGSDNTPVAAPNTALGAEADRVGLTSTTVSGATITYTATFPAGTATGALTEAGIFNGASGSTMLCRTVFPVVNKQAHDGLSIVWVVTAS